MSEDKKCRECSGTGWEDSPCCNVDRICLCLAGAIELVDDLNETDGTALLVELLEHGRLSGGFARELFANMDPNNRQGIFDDFRGLMERFDG